MSSSMSSAAAADVPSGGAGTGAAAEPARALAVRRLLVARGGWLRRSPACAAARRSCPEGMPAGPRERVGDMRGEVGPGEVGSGRGADMGRASWVRMVSTSGALSCPGGPAARSGRRFARVWSTSSLITRALARFSGTSSWRDLWMPVKLEGSVRRSKMELPPPPPAGPLLLPVRSRFVRTPPYLAISSVMSPNCSKTLSVSSCMSSSSWS
mmetsp:Transcript_10886/g.36936  ORF Transcript_10886/g.36936 Transcript_10886/m.36936 type:complete len:211 (+) Transcript_10886:334-966(+)